ncbi:MAG: hypothetical protein KAU20_02515 [Nanoarchaeota archaeon]|nr:hypothetical protein [Nanoarchaeota archaeon]
MVLETDPRNDMLDGLVDNVDEGSGTTEGVLVIGTTGMATTLVTIPLNNPAFDAAAAGSVAMDVTPEPEEDAVATGVAAAFEIQDRDATKIMSGSVGTTGKDLNLNSVNIETGVPVKITAATITQPAGSPA